MTEAQQDQSLPIDIEELIEDFGAQMGRMQAQAIVDRKIHAAKEKQWAEREQSLLEHISSLGERLSALEAVHPAEPSSEAGSGEAIEGEVVTPSKSTKAK